MLFLIFLSMIMTSILVWRNSNQNRDVYLQLWYYLRGTPDENGNPMGYGTIAKKLGVTIDDVKNAFKKYKRGKVW